MTIAPFAAGTFFSRETARGLTDMRRAGEVLQRQISTGRMSDTFAGLGFERRTSLDARGQLSRLESFQATIQRADARLKATIQAVERLDKIAADTRSMARSTISDVRDSEGRPQAQALARTNLAFAIDVLNTEFGGNYLFAGRASDQAPILAVGQIIDDLQAAISPADLADPAVLLDRVTAFFDADPPAWQPLDADLQSSAPPVSARETALARIDEGESVAIGARANEDAFRRMLVGLATLAIADTSPGGMTPQEYDTLARGVATFMGEGPQPRNVAVDLGLAHARLGAAKERHQMSAALLQQTIDGVEGVSTEEVAVSLISLQTRLQASYQTTSTLSRLSLVTFLR